MRYIHYKTKAIYSVESHTVRFIRALKTLDSEHCLATLESTGIVVTVYASAVDGSLFLLEAIDSRQSVLYTLYWGPDGRPWLRKTDVFFECLYDGVGWVPRFKSIPS
jgi:hypothetical protein